MDIPYEKIWLELTDIECDQVNFLKNKFFIMKDMDTCFVIAELDFTTTNIETNIINISIPILKKYQFIPCENTTFAIKNDDINTLIKIKLIPGTLILESFPFNSNTKYELNIQLFFMIKNPTRIDLINMITS